MHRLVARLVIGLTLLFLCARPAAAQTGAIAGTVTREDTGTPLQGIHVTAYLSGAGFPYSTVTNAAGAYTISGLSPGTYYLVTLGFLDVVDELYPNTPCPDTVCTLTSGSPIVVSSGTTTGSINLALAAGTVISGKITVAATASPVQGVSVRAYSAAGTNMGSWQSNASGVYQLHAVPAGTSYARTFAGGLYPDELYDNHPCSPSCTVTSGTPIVGVAGQPSTVNFALGAGGGTFNGTVTNARTGAALAGIAVKVFNASGTEVATATSGASGAYLTPELPPGTYYARTDAAASGAYADTLFNALACLSDCTPLDGTPIVVSANTSSSLIDFWLEPNLVRNSQFTNGTNKWSLYATPDASYLTSSVVNGVFEYYRVPPPPSTSNQAVIFQNTGAAVDASAPLVAQFELGNSSTVRKRISVLILDSDFSDLAVCTFWLPANAPLRAYRMLTHTTEAWTNASIYFYAASAGSDDGAYRLDNVLLYRDPLGAATSTQCVDPTRPPAPGGLNDPTLLTNGDFATGSLAPWSTFGTITTQVAGGVLEFTRPASTPPAGVVLQATNQAMAAQQLLTATFRLGNSSGARKRVTVLLHDLDFSDLAACTFWLPPGQPLSTYIMRTFATKAWANATLSVYPATTDAAGWTQLDDVAFFRAVVPTSGTDCFEPFGGGLSTSPRAGSRNGSLMTAAAPPAALRGGAVTDRRGVRGREVTDATVPIGVSSNRDGIVASLNGIDLRGAARASLRFTSALDEPASGEVQVRVDGRAWVTLLPVQASTAPELMELDLTGLVGGVVDVRFVLDDEPAEAEAGEGCWRVSEPEVETN